MPYPHIFAKMKLDKIFLDEAQALLNSSQKIVITNHINPDGDAMGSALGLASVLKLVGKEVRVIVPNDYPEFLKWMEGSDEVINYEEHSHECEHLINSADLIFHLDYNSLKRSGSLEHLFLKAKARKIMIDHHQQPEGFADIQYSDPEMSSTCEMVYHLIESLNLLDHLGLGAAEALYTGLITDTGSFRFSSTSSVTHKVAANLLHLGVQPQIIASRVFDANRPERMFLLARMLQKMELLKDYNTVILSLSTKDLSDFNYLKGDTEGFVNYGLSIKGVELSIFLYPSHDKVKMSFRSKTNFNVNRFARNHFNGGGHINAAGGISTDTVEEIIEKIKKILPEYAETLSDA